MRRSTRMRKSTVVAIVGTAAALAGASAAKAQERPADAGLPATAFGRMTAPSLSDAESGVPPRSLRLRAIVSRAWDDSIATWKRLMQPLAPEVEMVGLRFVRRLGPANCYGLYAGEGPAYCSGNRTVFVGTNAANRLMAKFGTNGEAGITFLIGHEMGHHIQNIYGRFHLLNQAVARAPASRADLMRRFELEADCFAGVWIHASDAWASSSRFRAELSEVLKGIGDESILGSRPAESMRGLAVHGTSAQRRRWFTRGVKSGDWRACNTFRVARP